MVVQKQVMLQEDLFVQLVNTVHKVQLILKYVQMDNTVLIQSKKGVYLVIKVIIVT
jgi:hypothetical protein